MRWFPVLLFWLCAAQLGAADSLKPEGFSAKVAVEVGYRYLISRPQEGDGKPEKGWPLILFLHGSGERGRDLEQLKKHGPPKLVAAGRELQAIVASPQCEPQQIWNPVAVKALTDHLLATESVDPSRVYLTGLSMGGFGTWETAMEYPQTYAAIAPICGGAGVRWVMAERIRHLPCWIFHGDQDRAVPVEFSHRMHEALKKAGAPVKLTVYPSVGHDSWTQTYDDPAFWRWLLAQKRP